MLFTKIQPAFLETSLSTFGLGTHYHGKTICHKLQKHYCKMKYTKVIKFPLKS